MIQCDAFFKTLKEGGVSYYTGVPDSLLGSISAWLIEHEPDKHIIAANEGNAVGIAAGYHLATGKIAAVYLQNSGIGNIVNPVSSLLHEDVYGIPVLFIVGWRGEPGVHDEPQHVFQGKATIPMLEAMEIPTEVLSSDWEVASVQLAKALEQMHETNTSYAFVIQKNTFETVKFNKQKSELPLTRERAVEIIVGALPEESVVVSTTGKLSRELFEIRERRGEGHGRDFLTVGSMGHASSIAYGIAASCERLVCCLDGDGAVLMHMGALPVLGQQQRANLKYVVINNGCHESVGGQPTVGMQVDLKGIAEAAGFKKVIRCKTELDLKIAMIAIEYSEEPVFMEVWVNSESRADLGRPSIPAKQNKEAFMEYLRS